MSTKYYVEGREVRASNVGLVVDICIALLSLASLILLVSIAIRPDLLLTITTPLIKYLR